MFRRRLCFYRRIHREEYNVALRHLPKEQEYVFAHFNMALECKVGYK